MLPLLEFPVPVVEELAPLLGLSGNGCNSGGGRGSSSGEAVGGGGDGGSTAAAAGAAAVQESKQLELVVDRYTEALSADSSLLLPILGSLFELPLTGKLAAKAAALACDALSVGRLLFILYLKGLIQFRSPSFLSNMNASHTAISVQSSVLLRSDNTCSWWVTGPCDFFTGGGGRGRADSGANTD
jgi:hypothetical protein